MLVKDLQKSVEEYIKDAERSYIVPILIREKYPDIIKLIVETDSMDVEEQEYWLQIMPIMSEMQTQKLYAILAREKEQIGKLNSEYDSKMSDFASKNAAVLDAARFKDRITKIKEDEKIADVEESNEETELLKQLETL